MVRHPSLFPESPTPPDISESRVAPRMEMVLDGDVVRTVVSGVSEVLVQDTP